MKFIFPLALLSILLTGCREEATNDVQYYSDNTDARKEKIAECANNPGALSKTTNCINAKASLSKAMTSSSAMPSIQ